MFQKSVGTFPNLHICHSCSSSNAWEWRTKFDSEASSSSCSLFWQTQQRNWNARRNLSQHRREEQSKWKQTWKKSGQQFAHGIAILSENLSSTFLVHMRDLHFVPIFWSVDEVFVCKILYKISLEIDLEELLKAWSHHIFADSHMYQDRCDQNHGSAWMKSNYCPIDSSGSFFSFQIEIHLYCATIGLQFWQRVCFWNKLWFQLSFSEEEDVVDSGVVISQFYNCATNFRFACSCSSIFWTRKMSFGASLKKIVKSPSKPDVGLTQELLKGDVIFLLKACIKKNGKICGLLK